MLLVGAILASALLTWAARGYAVRRQLLDQPGERRSHVVATPRGGGVAIVLVQFCAALSAALVWPTAKLPLLLFAAGLLLVAGIGWWDDHRPLPALRRLAVHIVAAALLGAAAAVLGAALWQVVLCFLLAAALINIWNFMDGINGIASTQAIAAALGFALVLPAPLSFAPLLVAASCVGFLPFNFPRARIFMGDVGSGTLGYSMAALFTLMVVTMPGISWLMALVPFSAFLVDAGFTLVSRILSRQRWMEPHTQHVYQRAVKAGAGHAGVTAAFLLVALCGAAILVLSSPLDPLQQAGLAVAWWVFLTCLWFFARLRLRNH